MGGVGGVFVAGVLILMGLPLLQLAAVVIAGLILVAGESGQANSGVELRRLGRIAIGSIVGTAAGLLIMYAIYLTM